MNPPLLTTHPLFSDLAVILLRLERITDAEGMKGTFIGLSREQVDGGSALCGVRAQAIIVLDETLDDQWKREVAMPILISGAFRARQEGLLP